MDHATTYEWARIRGYMTFFGFRWVSLQVLGAAKQWGAG